MGTSRIRRAAVVYLILQVATVALALWLSKQFQVARLAATAIAIVPTLPAAYLAWIGYRDDRAEAAADAEPKVRALAAAVAAAETRQRAQLIGPGAHRIDLAFRYQQEPANNATGAAPQGHLTGVVDYYRRLRPARLIITGEPGAGKTLLALDLLLGLLAHRAEADPVPVRASLASWDTTRPLEDWLADQVHDQLRGHGLTAADARALVDQHRVLPILDGLDEMDTDTTPAAHRRATRALEQLNTYQNPAGSAPVVLTCRTAQYAQLAALDVRMREAARIEIAPADAAQATAYLTARSTNPARWAPVLDTLTAAPGGTLARALSTPWRLNLAATAYEERHPDTLAYLRDPADLLTLASPSQVRDHLLAHYLPAAGRQHPTRPDRYRPDQVHRWLAALAAHLAPTTSAAAGARTDIVLHQLWPMAGPRRVRTADALITTLVALAFTALLLSQVPTGSPTRQLTAGAFPALAGFLAIWRACSASVPAPRTGQLQRLRSPAQRRQLGQTMTGGLAGALVFALPGGLVGGLASGLAGARGGALAAALAGGLTGALTLGLTDSAADTAPRSNFAPPTDPRHPVRDDYLFGLAIGLTIGLIGGLLGGLTGGLAIGMTVGPTAGLTLGLTGGLATGLAVGMHLPGGASRRYIVFLLCSRGRLPRRLGAFLHWAHEAGLLRISGMAYQFRHRELQDWLATRPLP